MQDKTALESLKLPELKEIAKKLNIKKADTLKKQDLIARILEEQGGAAPKVTNRLDTDEMAAMATADEAPEPQPDPEPPVMTMRRTTMMMTTRMTMTMMKRKRTRSGKCPSSAPKHPAKNLRGTAEA